MKTETIIKTALAFALISSLSACDKTRNNQSSAWFVNNEHFETRDVTFATSKGGNYLSTASTAEGFNLGWKITSPPSPGYQLISIDYVSNNPAQFRVTIMHGGSAYELSRYNSDSVKVSLVNGKTRYELPAAWFINTKNVADSALIHGTFNEP